MNYTDGINPERDLIATWTCGFPIMFINNFVGINPDHNWTNHFYTAGEE